MRTRRSDTSELSVSLVGQTGGEPEAAWVTDGDCGRWLAVAVVGGVAFAAGEDTADEAIHACISRGLLALGKGSIRIVDNPK